MIVYSPFYFQFFFLGVYKQYTQLMCTASHWNTIFHWNITYWHMLPRVGVEVGVRVWVGLGLVYLVLEHEVFREAGLRSRDKILCSDWSPPLLVEELTCRHVGQDKLFFKNAALYVKCCVETFFWVKVRGKYVIQT